MDRLLRLYWKPLYFFIRRKGFDNETSKDILQEFLAEFLKRRSIRKANQGRGRFRTFMLTSLGHFLVDYQRAASREKRGGQAHIFSLDLAHGEEEYVREIAAREESPERLAQRAWARALLEQCLGELRGDPVQLEVFKARLRGLDYRQIAEWTGMMPSQAHLAVHRVGRQFGRILGDHLRQTTTGPDELEEELSDFLAHIS
jgi:RNA polymerase sigma-70 factor (ECF subfamily)